MQSSHPHHGQGLICFAGPSAASSGNSGGGAIISPRIGRACRSSVRSHSDLPQLSCSLFILTPPALLYAIPVPTPRHRANQRLRKYICVVRLQCCKYASFFARMIYSPPPLVACTTATKHRITNSTASRYSITPPPVLALAFPL